MRNFDDFPVTSAASLGQAIRHFRRSHGLTQRDLARRTGLNRTYVSGLENGRETEQLTRLLRVLGELGLRLSVHPEETR